MSDVERRHTVRSRNSSSRRAGIYVDYKEDTSKRSGIYVGTETEGQSGPNMEDTEDERTPLLRQQERLERQIISEINRVEAKVDDLLPQAEEGNELLFFEDNDDLFDDDELYKTLDLSLYDFLKEAENKDLPRTFENDNKENLQRMQNELEKPEMNISSNSRWENTSEEKLKEYEEANQASSTKSNTKWALKIFQDNLTAATDKYFGEDGKVPPRKRPCWKRLCCCCCGE